MHQIITIGSALVDVFIHTPAFQKVDSPQGAMLCHTHGDKLELKTLNVYTGGGGSNSAVGFARLGFETAVICETGRDNFAYLVKQDFIENQVDTKLIIEEKKEQTGGSIILVCDEGERTVLVHRGASSLLDPFDIPGYWLAQAQRIHLTSIGGRQPTLEKIFSVVENSSQTKLSWNPGKSELSLLANRQLSIKQVPADIFIVNQREWDLVHNVQEEILQEINLVAVTAGSKGGEVYQQGQHLTHFPALSSKVVDTTGAGDSFSVGFVAATMLGKSAQEAAQLGSKNAASVVAYYGAKPGMMFKKEWLQ